MLSLLTLSPVSKQYKFGGLRGGEVTEDGRCKMCDKTVDRHHGDRKVCYDFLL